MEETVNMVKDQQIRNHALAKAVDILKDLPIEVLKNWLSLPDSEQKSALLEGLMNRF